MEQIQIFDSTTNRNVNVFIAQEIAEKCRLDANFAAELVRQIEEQNVEEGSTIEIETVADVQSAYIEGAAEKELWSRKETLKFLKLYQKYHQKYVNNRKCLWVIISKELERRNIMKPPERCLCKWKNLMRSYKSAKERNNISRFQYYKAVDDLLNEKGLILSDTDSDLGSCNEEQSLEKVDIGNLKPKEIVEKECWSRYETIRFLIAYQNYEQKLLNKTYGKDQIWKFISNELSKEGITKTPEKCTVKWKNLYRSYKKILEKDRNLPIQRFKYFKEVDDLINKREIYLPDDLSSDTPDECDLFDSNYEDYSVNENIEFEIKEETASENGMLSISISNWSKEENDKLFWLHKKHKLTSFQNKDEYWKLISQELENAGFNRDARECEIEWNLQSHPSLKTQSTTNHNEDSIGESAVLDENQEKQSDKFCSNEDGDVGDEYEKIIIETETDTDANHKENHWNNTDITVLISSCLKHIKKCNADQIDNSVWKIISTDVERSGIHKTPEDCKSLWDDLFSTYKTCKKLNMDCTKFSFFDKIDEVFNKSNERNGEIGSNGNNRCKCAEKRLIEKQKRHSERMQILKRKLDIEERKVKAFEEYVKYIKR